MKKLVLALLFAIQALAQTKATNGIQAPSTVVASLPTASANTGMRFVISDGASTTDCTSGSGSAKVNCISNGTTWIAIPGGSGSGLNQLTGDVTAGPGSGSQAAAVVKVNGGSVPASQGCVGTNGSSQFIAGTCPGTPFTVMSVTKTSGPVLTIGAECTTSNYCNVGIGSKSYQFSTSATATITAGTGTAFIYVSSAGVLTVASNVTVTCSSCTAVVGTSFPDGSKPLYRWTATSSTVWDTFDPSFDFRAYLSTSYITPLTGGLVTYTNGVASVGPDQIVVAFKYFTTAAPGSIAGNLPGDLAVDTTNHNAYVCNAPSGTAAPACTSVTTAGWLLLNGGGGSSAFSSLTSGTNTGAAMVVGSGASIAVSGSGTNAATSAPVSGLTGAGTGVLTALAANVSGTGAICLASGSACGSGSSPAFSALTSATNTTAAMVVGTGASLAASGSGTIAATAAPIAGLTGAGTGVLTALAANVSGTGAICLASGSACAGGGGSPGGSTTQLQYNNAGSFGGISGATTNGTVVTLTNPSLTGTVTNAQGTLTGSSTPAYTHTVTLNNAATAFIDDYRNITNTASDFGSAFAKWQLGGTDRYNFNLAGDFETFGGSVEANVYYLDPGGVIRGRDSMGDATTIYFPAAGKLLLSNYVQSDFSMLQFGTTTSADPALKMNGTTIEAKLADDSAYTTFTALQVQSKVTTVSGLGTCNSGAEGTRRGVTDALVPVALATVAGGGSVHVGVYCDGTNWIVQ